MCGVLGYIGELDFDIQDFSKANDLIAHRGPDDSGIWVDENKKAILGHRRLSILDLSSNGAQPMKSWTGRFIISFNGEIYNHLEIRKKLATEFNISSSSWKGSSDTETILACLECLGFESTLELISGMFSFGVWDKKQNKIYLTRDRVGEKPLYFSFQKKGLYFSSELKSIRYLIKEKLQICPNSLGLFFKYSYIPSPYSIFKNTFKLEPGSYLEISSEEIKSLSFPISYKELSDRKIIQKFWSLGKLVSSSKEKEFSSKEEAIYEVEKGLSESVKSQLISDVPLGAFLSGGIDSSLITALMQKNSTKKVKTFTIGFNEEEFDESIYAKKISEILGTDHTEHIISMDDALKIIPNIPSVYDEPFADSSQIPTILVSAITRENVTVALSGDGGDEFFGGYNRHFRVPELYNFLKKFPKKYRNPLGTLVRQINNKAPFLTKSLVSIFLKSPSAQVGDKIDKLIYRINNSNSEIELYRSFLMEWDKPSSLVFNSKNVDTFIDMEKEWPNFKSFEEKMMFLDAKTYLPDDIMVKVDRASMSQSLETRAPFLDRNMVELSLRTPVEYKIQNGNGKLILKEILSKYIEARYFLRPKQGFGIPIANWLKGPLKESFEDLTSEALLKDQGFLNYSMINKRWKEHNDGTHNWGHSLWSIFMFQLWLNENSS